MHPLRLQYELFSNANPMMAPVGLLAEQVRKNRKPWRPTILSSPCRRTCPVRSSRLSMPGGMSTETVAERTFLTVYGSPTLQAAVGIDPDSTRPLRRAGQESACISELLQKRIAELKSRIPAGGLREAVIRGLLYAGMGRGARRRTRVRGGAPPSPGSCRHARCRNSRRLVREQFYMLLIDPEAALAAIPSMLPADAKTRRKAFDAHQGGHERTRRTVGRGRGAAAARRPAVRLAEEASTVRKPRSRARTGEGIMTVRRDPRRTPVSGEVIMLDSDIDIGQYRSDWTSRRIRRTANTSD